MKTIKEELDRIFDIIGIGNIIRDDVEALIQKLLEQQRKQDFDAYANSNGLEESDMDYKSPIITSIEE